MSLAVLILTWNSPKTLIRTLNSYRDNGLVSNQRFIYFQQIKPSDQTIASEYKMAPMGSPDNIGIGPAFLKLAQQCDADKILFLENDFKLVEGPEVTAQRLKEASDFLDNGFDAVKLRHRHQHGLPLCSAWLEGKELEHQTHLLESVHWCDPAELFPEFITRHGEWFAASSKNANYTNNPTMYRRDWWIKNIGPFCTGNLEDTVQNWWEQQDFKVLQGEGLFCHDRRD